MCARVSVYVYVSVVCVCARTRVLASSDDAVLEVDLVAGSEAGARHLLRRLWRGLCVRQHFIDALEEHRDDGSLLDREKDIEKCE